MNDTGITTIGGLAGENLAAFFLQFWPADAPRAHIIYLPPFGEEMNRCRAIVAEQGRRFARQGLSCSLVDFYGTGESPGELWQATLDIWRQNIDAMIQQLLQRCECPVYLWGCRLGGLLALDYIQSRCGSVAKLLLWQPVLSGTVFTTQLLRQRTAALMQRGEKGENTAAMKTRLAAGDIIEVGGYKLGGELMTALDQLAIENLNGGGIDAVFWLEHSAEALGEINKAALRCINKLQQSGARVSADTFAGDPVWQLHKRGSCPELLEKTGLLSL